jgi:hypothetical protein
MFLPSSSLPFISAMAFNMACSSAKVTKPKPLDLPVSRSEMTTHEAPVLRLSHFFQRKEKKTTQLLL